MSIRVTLLLSVLAVACLCGSAFSTTYYVATWGSDSNPGSSAAPWLTLQKAVDTILPGDTAYVKAGTYPGCRVSRSGAAGAVCTLAAEPGASVLINTPGAASVQNSLIEVEWLGNTVRYWVFDGFELANSPHHGYDIRTTEYITVRNSYIHGTTPGTGIFWAFSYYNTAEYNESSYNAEHGIYHSNSGDYQVMRGNNVHANAGCGIHNNGDVRYTPGDGYVSFGIYEKNVIWDNGVAGGAALNFDGGNDNIIRNNLVYNNVAGGLSLFAVDGAGGSSRNKVYNNTFVFGAEGRDVVNIPVSKKVANPTANVVMNNILYTDDAAEASIMVWGAGALAASDYNVGVNRWSINGSTIITLAQWQAYGFDTHTLLSTPALLFVNPAGLDYHLKAGSPAIDAGTNLSPDVTNDMDGVSRPQGAAYDIGCYEYGSSGTAPVANFTGNPTSGTAPLTVMFTDTSTGSPTSWSWTFGDGGTSTAQSPSHSYAAGTYTVSLTATNAYGSDSETKSSYITASTSGSPPVANFTGTPTSGVAPLAVAFTDTSTNTPTAWSWNFGDSTTSTSQNPSHTYAAGTYTVSLRATNAYGYDDEVKTSYITASAAGSPPVANFTGTPTSGTAPLAVAFTDTSTNTPTSWSWNFGDGSTSTVQNPSHTYAAGTYTVSLRATNAYGYDDEVKTSYITATSGGGGDYFCTSIAVTGTIQAGDHTSVHASDNSYLQVAATKLSGNYTTAINYTYETGLGSLSSLIITSESHPTVQPQRQRVSLWNYTTSLYDTLDDRNLTSTSDTTTTVTVTSGLSSYRSATGQVIVRIRTGDLSGTAWTHYIDLVKITAAP